MNCIRRLSALIIIILAASLAFADDAASPQDLCQRAQPGELTPMQFQVAEPALEAGLDYRAILCTSAGAIYVDLYESQTPLTVNNFVFLAQQGYYDGTTFHRVIPGFMAQAGDPTGTGRGGPGYRFGDEPVSFLAFTRPGLLAMANAGPGTNGSQFFITTAPTPHLNFKHTIFGEVLLGQAVVEAIRERDPQAASSPGEALHTVLIIDDPALVDSSEIVTMPPATSDQVASIFAAFAKSLPPALAPDQDRSGHFSTDDLAAAVSDDLSAGFASFAAEHGHQYRQRIQLTNADCGANIFFSSLGYWLDIYADAAAAANDAFMLSWLESYGYAPVSNAPGVYTAAATTCAGEPGLHLLSLRPIGRFLVTLDVLVAESILQQVSAPDLLTNLTFQIEPGFADVFLPELRG